MKHKSCISERKAFAEKILSLCIVTFMLLLISGMDPTAKAANNDIIFMAGNGTRIDEDANKTGWSYVAATKTLTLNNWNTNYSDGSGVEAAIKYEGSEALTINLQGNNTIEWNDNVTYNLYGIYAPNAAITIGGSGTLTCISKNSGIYTGTITVKNGTVDSTSADIAISAKNINITGGTVNATSTGMSNGIYASEGNVTISGGSVTAKAGYNCICSSKSILISGGKVTAEGSDKADSYGLYSGSGPITISGGEVTSESKGSSIVANGGDVKISGGKVIARSTNGFGIVPTVSVIVENGITGVTAEGGISAIKSYNALTIGDDLMIKEPENGSVGTSSGYKTILDGSTAAKKVVIVPNANTSTNPGTSDPVTTDPDTTDSGTTDPGTTDPDTTDPVTPDQGIIEQQTLKTKIKNLKLSGSKKAVKVTWDKLSKKDLKTAKKIQIQISTDKKFQKDVITKTVAARKTSCTFKKLQPGRKYYVRIRAYTPDGNTWYVSKWFRKNIKLKK